MGSCSIIITVALVCLLVYRDGPRRGTIVLVVVDGAVGGVDTAGESGTADEGNQGRKKRRRSVDAVLPHTVGRESACFNNIIFSYVMSTIPCLVLPVPKYQNCSWMSGHGARPRGVFLCVFLRLSVLRLRQIVRRVCSLLDKIKRGGKSKENKITGDKNRVGVC